MQSKPEHTDNKIKRLLMALGEKMQERGLQPVDLVVCGGAALNVLGLVCRPTRDVDVLAFFGATGLKEIEELPLDLRECAAEVAEDFGEKPNWLNDGPRKLFQQGLPEGMRERLIRETFGPCLRVYWTSRIDLICMKVYAASDDMGERQQVHIADLKQLNPKPSEEELNRAIEWRRKLPKFDEHSIVLKQLLSELGHEDLAYYV
jgi:hypothetical protein